MSGMNEETRGRQV